MAGYLDWAFEPICAPWALCLGALRLLVRHAAPFDLCIFLPSPILTAPSFHDFSCTAALAILVLLLRRAGNKLTKALRQGIGSTTRARAAPPKQAPNLTILRAELLLQMLVAEAF